MIAISQLLQVLQTSEAAVPQPTGQAENPAPGGLAKLFGAILEQARATFGETIALPDGSAVTQTETGTDVQGSGEVESGEGPAPSYEGLPIEHAASVLEALGKFEALPIEHAASVLEALSARGEAELVEGGEDSVPVDSETTGDTVDAGDTGEDGDVVEVAITAAPNSVDEVVGELLAAMSAVPVQAVPVSEDRVTTEAPAAAAQPDRAPAQASPGPGHSASVLTRLESGLLVAASKATGRPEDFEVAGLPPGSGLLRAMAKSAAQGEQSADVRGSAVPAPPAVEGETAFRPTLSDVFARAVTRQQAQAQPTSGVETRVAETLVFDPIEVLAPATKPQGAPAPTLAPPGPVEVVQAAVPKSSSALPQSIPDRPLPEVVHVRNVGDFTVKTVRYLAGRNEEVVTVRLVPRSLGELHIAVRSTGQSIEVVITAATHAARDAIEAQLPGLREALVRDGGDVKNVTIQTSTAGDQGPGHFGPGNSATSGHAARTGMKFTGDHAEPQADSRASPRGSAGHEGTLNMFV